MYLRSYKEAIAQMRRFCIGAAAPLLPLPLGEVAEQSEGRRGF